MSRFRHLLETFKGAEETAEKDYEQAALEPENWLGHLRSAAIHGYGRQLHYVQCKKHAPGWMLAMLFVGRNLSLAVFFALGALAYRLYLSWFVL